MSFLLYIPRYLLGVMIVRCRLHCACVAITMQRFNILNCHASFVRRKYYLKNCLMLPITSSLVLHQRVAYSNVPAHVLGTNTVVVVAEDCAGGADMELSSGSDSVASELDDEEVAT